MPQIHQGPSFKLGCVERQNWLGCSQIKDLESPLCNSGLHMEIATV